ncbi:hypothetical protein CROQUDRAFT_660299 [Cronartium quercuum f. sp. fusiforme G11]|uniref:BTB domain-containing protein n=1 Tax=Cronartium quercuum f. sp. fusiforme G11 TaxID=708437 RepID=A0A9P6NIG1_9BASI|nr:hypothetical protein CROQUDRAFT_660299 [Cronartium quercuum f. sp. fusiforme G11]
MSFMNTRTGKVCLRTSSSCHRNRKECTAAALTTAIKLGAHRASTVDTILLQDSHPATKSYTMLTAFDHALTDQSQSRLIAQATKLSSIQSDSSRPFSQKLSYYYHPLFPCFSSTADVVLASVETPSCYFAVESSQIFSRRPESFGSGGPFKPIGFHHSRPIFRLQEPKSVIELILQCMVGDCLPDFSKVPFSDIVEALEIASDKYHLAHMEKICLLALGAYCQEKPIHVFVLASHYSCDWLARAASQYTISCNLDDDELKDILMVETYQALAELQRSRVESALRLVRRLHFKPSHPTNCGSPLTSTTSCSHYSCTTRHKFVASQFMSKARSRLIKRITRPDVNMRSLLSFEILRPAIRALTCESCIEELLTLCEDVSSKWDRVPKHIP